FAVTKRAALCVVGVGHRYACCSGGRLVLCWPFTVFAVWFISSWARLVGRPRVVAMALSSLGAVVIDRGILAIVSTSSSRLPNVYQSLYTADILAGDCAGCIVA